MKKVIVVCGAPCSGKTTLAKILVKKLDAIYIGLDEVKKIDKAIVIGYDEERKVEIIDEDKYSDAVARIIKKSKKPVVIDLHFAYEVDPKFVDLCVVCRCNLKELRRRMEERGYPEKKIRENLEAEIFEEFGTGAREKGHKIIEVNTTSPIDSKIIKYILD